MTQELSATTLDQCLVRQSSQKFSSAVDGNKFRDSHPGAESERSWNTQS